MLPLPFSLSHNSSFPGEMSHRKRTREDGFVVSQAALGQPLQFEPALGTVELDNLINAFIPGPEPVSQKRARVTIDFLNTVDVSSLPGPVSRLYHVPSPVRAAVQPPESSPTSSSSSTSAKRPRNDSTSNPVKRHPGFSIMTKDGVDITEYASRGPKTKEQRDHAALMRKIGSCAACKKKKQKCDPSHHKTRDSSAQASGSKSYPSTSSSRPSISPQTAMTESFSPLVSKASSSQLVAHTGERFSPLATPKPSLLPSDFVEYASLDNLGIAPSDVIDPELVATWDATFPGLDYPLYPEAGQWNATLFQPQYIPGSEHREQDNIADAALAAAESGMKQSAQSTADPPSDHDWFDFSTFANTSMSSHFGELIESRNPQDCYDYQWGDLNVAPEADNTSSSRPLPNYSTGHPSLLSVMGLTGVGKSSLIQDIQRSSNILEGPGRSNEPLSHGCLSPLRPLANHISPIQSPDSLSLDRSKRGAVHLFDTPRSDNSELSSLDANYKGRGLVGLRRNQGGLPVPELAAHPLQSEVVKPVVDHSYHYHNNLTGHEEDEDEAAEEGYEGMDFDPSTSFIRTFTGFQDHMLQLKPKIESSYLIDSIAHQHMAPYKALLQSRVKHSEAILAESLGPHHIESKGSATHLKAKRKSRNDSISNGLNVTGDISNGDSNPKGQLASESIPLAVSVPPTTSFSSEFECQLCFGVEKFQKPSDWTKHVHEDVQPFTCTSAHCRDPKSFKRKADWVRHENELHRHLERWTCQIEGCTHKCCRKDNLLQHLVQEYKMGSPKHQTKAALRNAISAEEVVSKQEFYEGGRHRWQERPAASQPVSISDTQITFSDAQPETKCANFERQRTKDIVKTKLLDFLLLIATVFCVLLLSDMKSPSPALAIRGCSLLPTPYCSWSVAKDMSMVGYHQLASLQGDGQIRSVLHGSGGESQVQLLMLSSCEDEDIPAASVGATEATGMDTSLHHSPISTSPSKERRSTRSITRSHVQAAPTGKAQSSEKRTESQMHNSNPHTVPSHTSTLYPGVEAERLSPTIERILGSSNHCTHP